MLNFFNRGGRDNPADASPAAPTSSASPVTGPGRPIRLVYCDKHGKFRMDPKAVATLQLVKEPIGVVSICGLPRQGKSFILNQEEVVDLKYHQHIGHVPKGFGDGATMMTGPL